MHLDRLIAALGPIEVANAAPLEIAELAYDTRNVAPGSLFFCVPGARVDGHELAGDAVRAGATALVVEHVVDVPVTQLVVGSVRAAMPAAAVCFFGDPSRELDVAGFTGTNGKTTSAFLLASILDAAERRPALLTNIERRIGGELRPTGLNTPESIDLQRLFREMLAAGDRSCVMEATSIAAAKGRLDGTRFKVLVFTNLTQDHLDFHGTMQAYAESKAKLFRELLTDDGVGVVNMDTEWGAFMLQEVRGRALGVATSGVPDILVTSSRQTVDGIDAEFMTPIGAVRVRSPLIGAFNLENLAVGVGIGVGLGLDAATIARGLGGVRGVPGRVERVDNDRGFGIFVDYAHTPDALERVMAALRPLTRGRLIVVFGCGGDRDKTKRPKMGAAVARDADLPIVTSDNPRTEDPRAIIDMIVEGVRTVRQDGFVVEVDRRAAIGAAVAAARAGDIVLIAGKGHEDYQILGKVKHHFDDREEARAALAKVANRPANGQS